MNTLSNEEREALRSSFQRLMNDASSESAVRATMETTSGYDPELWQQMGDMGVTGLIIDEEFGGSGVGPMELEAIMEEVGAALLCSPLLASSVISAKLLTALGDEERNQALLPQIACGKLIVSSVLTGDSGCWTPDGISVKGAEKNGQWTLKGSGNYVLHAQNAQVLLIVAGTDEGLSVFEVEADNPKLEIHALPTFDRTLRLSTVALNDTPAKKLKAKIPAWDAVKQTLDLALVALAGEQAGGSQKVLDFTTEYAKTRIQFGRAIGSFQAIKHMAADLLLETESAISAARYAASCLAENSEKRDQAISLAAFACADAFSKVTTDGLQMHGGIGFTWEHPIHLYLRRARAAAQLFGASDTHRENYLKALGA